MHSSFANQGDTSVRKPTIPRRVSKEGGFVRAELSAGKKNLRSYRSLPEVRKPTDCNPWALEKKCIHHPSVRHRNVGKAIVTALMRERQPLMVQSK